MNEQHENGEGMGRVNDLVVNRRTVLCGSAVLSAMIASRGLAETTSFRPESIRFVMIDKRYRESTEFGRQLSSRETECLEVTEGLTALWHNRLVPHWREPGGIVSGLTTRPVWDCVSEQARGQFRKPKLIGVHRFGESDGGVYHMVNALHGLPGKNGKLGDDSWPTRMALLVRQCAGTGGLFDVRCHIGDAALETRAPTQLVSWMVI